MFSTDIFTSCANLYTVCMLYGLLTGLTMGLIMFVIGYTLFKFIGFLRSSI